MDAASLVGATATEIAEAVRSGQVTANDVTRAHLARIDEVDPQLGAFTKVLHERATAEAEAVDRRDDLDGLPLAGVPVAIKDHVAVRGVVTGNGSRALTRTPADHDDELVRRLNAAGAVVVGVTRCPELCVFGNSDDPDGAARNPWDPTRVAGGSSGGAAAAVAAGLVPVAHASDGLGSIRIPAAANGLVGIKPGRGLVPVEGDLDGQHWFGMTQHGPLATTVDDLALVLDVLADSERFRDGGQPDRELRVAVSTAPPAPGLMIGRQQRQAVVRVARALQAAGHHVEQADPPYDTRAMLDLLLRWTAGAAQDADDLGADLAALQHRTRVHAAVGRVARRLRPVREEQADRWKAKVDGFFDDWDLLVTPAMAGPPPRGHGWWDRGWLANVLQGLLWAPFQSPWNLAELPAASVPAGLDDLRLPLSAQVVARRGGEADLVAALRTVEQRAPWQRRPDQVTA
jgi:amidase